MSTNNSPDFTEEELLDCARVLILTYEPENYYSPDFRKIENLIAEQERFGRLYYYSEYIDVNETIANKLGLDFMAWHRQDDHYNPNDPNCQRGYQKAKEDITNKAKELVKEFKNYTKEELIFVLRKGLQDIIMFHWNNKKDNFYMVLDCSDYFDWACSDGQEITAKEISEIKTFEDKWGSYGPLLWVAIKRQLQPIQPRIKAIKKACPGFPIIKDKLDLSYDIKNFNN